MPHNAAVDGPANSGRLLTLVVRLPGIDMNINERKRNTYISGRVRLGIYSIFLAICLALPIIEMKTGYHIGSSRSRTRYVHDPWSWDEVWTHLKQLPDDLFIYLGIFVFLIFVTELWIRFGKTQKDVDEDANDHLSDSPPKPFTRLWLAATFGYMVLLIVPFYGYSNWGWDFPNMPLAFAPILISLGLLAIYTGEVQLRGGTFYRSRNPIMYWLCVAMALSLGILMFLGGIGIIGQ